MTVTVNEIQRVGMRCDSVWVVLSMPSLPVMERFFLTTEVGVRAEEDGNLDFLAVVRPPSA